MDSPQSEQRLQHNCSASTITIIDSLAEITRHQDRELLERSLAITLSELFPAESFKLFRVITVEDRLKVVLATYAKDGIIISDLNQNPEQTPLTPALLASVTQAIDSRSVVENHDDNAPLTNVIYPLYDKHDDVFGVLLQVTNKPDFNSQRLAYGLLRIYSNYLALLDESHRDRLTNLRNRQTLDAEVTKRIIAYAHNGLRSQEQRRKMDKQRSWLILIDVDHFKRINDGWGHLYGDEVLILMARLLEKIFRSDDLVFRYGGEEFVTLFEAPGESEANLVCERTRLTISKHNFPAVGHITVSIGGAEIRSQNGVSMVIDQADKALYYAKEHGRDQVQFFDDLCQRGLVEDNKPPPTSNVDFF